MPTHHRPVALLVAAGAGALDGVIRQGDPGAKGPPRPSTIYEAALAGAGIAAGYSSGIPEDWSEPLALVGVFALASKAVGTLCGPVGGCPPPLARGGPGDGGEGVAYPQGGPAPSGTFPDWDPYAPDVGTTPPLPAVGGPIYPTYQWTPYQGDVPKLTYGVGGPYSTYAWTPWQGDQPQLLSYGASIPGDPIYIPGVFSADLGGRYRPSVP